MLPRKRPYPFDNGREDETQLPPNGQEFETEFDVQFQETRRDIDADGAPGTEREAHVCFGSVHSILSIVETRYADIQMVIPRYQT
jgi:hypothetical protein